jgi:hypothetical protein
LPDIEGGNAEAASAVLAMLVVAFLPCMNQGDLPVLPQQLGELWRLLLKACMHLYSMIVRKGCTLGQVACWQAQ